MREDEPTLGSDVAVRRYGLGFAVLVVTVFLSNSFGFLAHPERVFDVVRGSGVAEQLHWIGFAGQLLLGCWLGFALILEVRPGRRVCLMLWLASLAAFFAPLPSAAEDVWMAPALAAVVVAVTALSRALDAALRQPAD